MIKDEDPIRPNEYMSQPDVPPEEPTCITYDPRTKIARNKCRRCLVVRVHKMHPQTGGVWASNLLRFPKEGRLLLDEFNGGGIQIKYQKPCPAWLENP